MTAPKPTSAKLVFDRLAARYLVGLRMHLNGRAAKIAPRALACGRATLASGLVVLDLVIFHERALLILASEFDLAEPKGEAIKRAGFFLTTALRPLEDARLLTMETNRHLRETNATLCRHTSELARGNRALKREVLRRKAGEAAVLRGKEEFRVLLIASQVMQKKLRQLTRQIIAAQEEERKEISRELHDEVVQTLVGINVELSALGKEASVGLHTLKAKIARTQRLVENSVDAVHRFARELRPAALDDLGLIPALHAYSTSLAERKKIKIRMAVFGGVEALAIDKRIVLFRVAQEALTNVVRHARASQVRINITDGGEFIRMEIVDDGRSFSVERTMNAPNHDRLGLIGMRERVEMVGGCLTVESVTGKGTTIRADIPVDVQKALK